MFCVWIKWVIYESFFFVLTKLVSRILYMFQSGSLANMTFAIYIFILQSLLFLILSFTISHFWWKIHSCSLDSRVHFSQSSFVNQLIEIMLVYDSSSSALQALHYWPNKLLFLKCMYFLQAVLIGSKRRYVRFWAPWESGKYEKYEIFLYRIYGALANYINSFCWQIWRQIKNNIFSDSRK